MYACVSFRMQSYSTCLLVNWQNWQSVPSRITLVVFEQFEQHGRRPALPETRKQTTASQLTSQLTSLDGPLVAPNDGRSSREKSSCEHKRCATSCWFSWPMSTQHRRMSAVDCSRTEATKKTRKWLMQSFHLRPFLCHVTGRTWPITNPTTDTCDMSNMYTATPPQIVSCCRHCFLRYSHQSIVSNEAA